jgi:hypothetical protein
MASEMEDRRESRIIMSSMTLHGAFGGNTVPAGIGSRLRSVASLNGRPVGRTKLAAMSADYRSIIPWVAKSVLN